MNLSSYALEVPLAGWFGVALVLLALTLFVIDLNATNHGAPAAGGVIALVLGGLMLSGATTLYFQVLLLVLLVGAILTGIVLVLVVRGALAVRERPATTGMEGMLGEVGVVKAPVGAEAPGWVLVRGEWWRAVAATAPEDPHEQEAMKIGIRVQVVGFTDGKIVVLPLEPATSERLPQD